MAIAIISSLVVGAVVYNTVNASVPTVPPTEDPGLDVTKILDSNYNLPVVYGERRLDGNIIFYDTTGTDNKYLDIVVAVCEGEIEGFTKIYLNDGAVPIFDAGASTLTKEVLLNTTHPLYKEVNASGTVIFNTSEYISKNGYITITDGSGSITLYPGTHFAIGGSLSVTITNLVNYLNSSGNPIISKATYVKRSSNDGFDITFKTTSTAGNQFKLSGRMRKNSWGGGVGYFSTTLSGGSSTNYIQGYFYNGSDSQAANSSLISAYPPVGSPGDDDYTTGWTSAHKLSGIAYVYIRMVYNPDLFSGGVPKFSFEVKGRKVYDPRTSTTIYSENNAICLRDYLLNSRFGKGLDPAALDEASIISAANDCEVSRSGLDVSGNPITYDTYAIGAIIGTGNPIKDNVANMLQSMNATLPFFDGTYFLKILQAGNPVVSFDEDSIVGSVDISSSTKQTRFNKTVVTFPDKDRHFKKGDAPIESAVYLAEDNDQLLEKRFSAPHTTYYPRARDLAELAMNTSRAGITAEFTTTMKAFEAVTGDIVGVTYPLFGWSSKEFRLEKIVSRLDGLCDVSLSEHNDAFYNLSEQQEQAGSSESNLADPTQVTRPVITSVASDADTHLVNSDGSIVPRIYITWSNTDPYPAHYNIHLKKEGETAFTKVGQVEDGDSLTFYIPNLSWDTEYSVGISLTNGVGYTSPLAISTITVPNPLSGANYDYPDVKGLELVGEGTDQGQGNNTEFTGKDVKLQWRLSSNNVVYEFGSLAAEQLGAAGGVVPFTLTGYRVEVYHPTDVNPRQEYFVTDPSFVYTLDKNIEDGNGTPSRTVTFKISAVGQVTGYGLTGESETPAKITVTNPAPSLPSNFTVSTGFQTISLAYDRPKLADWSGILVWMDTSSGFTPSSANLVYSGTDNKIPLTGLTSGETYYIKYALIDSFVDADQKDSTGLTVSGETSTTTNVAVTSTEIESLIADKIAAGTLGEAVALGGVFVASGVEAVLNGTGPTLGTYRLDLGPVSHTGSTYVVNFYNGYDDAHGSYDSKFSIDESGNAIFGGDLNAAGGTFSDLEVASNGYIRGGQTAYDTGTGFWLGDDSGTKKFSIGDSTGNKLTWNGSNLNFTGDLVLDSNNYWKLSNNTFKIGDGTSNLTWDSSDLIVSNIKTASSGERTEILGTGYIKGYGDDFLFGTYQVYDIGTPSAFSTSPVIWAGNTGLPMYGIEGRSANVGVYGNASTDNDGGVGVRGYAKSNPTTGVTYGVQGYGYYGLACMATGGSSQMLLEPYTDSQYFSTPHNPNSVTFTPAPLRGSLMITGDNALWHNTTGGNGAWTKRW